MPQQEKLLELPATQQEAAASAERPRGPRKLKRVDRNQWKMLTLDVDTLVSADHRARAIWELTGILDLSAFEDEIRSEEGCAGRQHTDPRLLVAIWLYAYSESISSARAVSRQMEHEPGFRWLAGLEVINHTTLSEFRTSHRESLDEIFTQLLAVMAGAGLVDLEQVMHDGTKIEAQASRNSFRREKTVQKRLEQARRVVEQLGDPEDEQQQSRREAAQRRVARQQSRVLEQAVTELEEIRRHKRTAEDKTEARVSLTDPEARPMRHGNDGGISPSYNVQISTDAKQKVIVGVSVNQNGSDADVALTEVVDEVKDRLHREPNKLVVDGGYMGHQNVEEMAAAGVDLIGPLPDTAERQASARKASGIAEEFGGDRFQPAADGDELICPQGERLQRTRDNRKRGNLYAVYQAPGSACRQCASRQQCCPKGYQKGRSVSVLLEESAAVVTMREKMATEAAKQIYKKRSEVGETPNAWIKEKFGIRKFRLRGLEKVTSETLWACLTYNVMQWIRLVWRQRPEALPQPV
jgi:transposase